MTTTVTGVLEGVVHVLPLAVVVAESISVEEDWLRDVDTGKLGILAYEYVYVREREQMAAFPLVWDGSGDPSGPGDDWRGLLEGRDLMPVFPPGAVLMAAPSQMHSLGVTVTINGPVWSSEYGKGRLVDGTLDQPCRVRVVHGADHARLGAEPDAEPRRRAQPQHRFGPGHRRDQQRRPRPRLRRAGPELLARPARLPDHGALLDLGHQQQ